MGKVKKEGRSLFGKIFSTKIIKRKGEEEESQ